MIDYSFDNLEMRDIVVNSLKQLIQKNSKVIALEADLGAASGWSNIGKDYAQNFINVGIAESNMVGIAAGLSQLGFIPFIHSFSPFITRRAFDQLYISGGYAKNTLNIFGSDPGFAAATNGGTHTTWEDVALMKMIPNSIICDAADYYQMQYILETYAKLEGIHYVRATRKKLPLIYNEQTQFELGKGMTLLQGDDILFISSGELVYDTLNLANDLKRELQISSTVIDMFTIKPLDIDLLLNSIKDHKLIVTIENHSIYNGLGSSVAEVLAEEGIPVPLHRIGVKEEFGEVGSVAYLKDRFGYSSNKLLENIKQILKDKKLLD